MNAMDTVVPVRSVCEWTWSHEGKPRQVVCRPHQSHPLNQPLLCQETEASGLRFQPRGHSWRLFARLRRLKSHG